MNNENEKMISDSGGAAEKIRDEILMSEDTQAADRIGELEQKIADAKAAVPKRGIGSKIFIIIIALLVVLGIVRAIMLQFENDEEAEELTLTNVQVEQVSLGSVELTTPLAGRIQAKDTINVVPLASGEVQQVMVKVGDTVSAGQTLFTINSTQAQLTTQNAQLTVKNLEDSIATIETNLERTRTLYEAGAASKTDLEAIENTYNSTKIQLAQARIGVQQASDALGNYTVTAPSGGYVTQVNVVAGGAAGGSVAVVISDTSVLELSAGLSEYLISSVHVGDSVDVIVSSASDEMFKGTVTQISQAPSQGTFTYPVTVKVEDPQGLIKAGMFAEVRLISARKENVITVPSDAVITSGGENKVVMLNDDKETVSLRTVKVGIDDGTTAEITDGLSTGETIVVKGQSYVMDGEKVRVVK